MKRVAAIAIAALLLAGCAATSRDAAPGAGGATVAADSLTVVEVHWRRVADLAGSRGELRAREADLTVEYRALGGRGATLDLGRVTLDGIELPREVVGRGDQAKVRYRVRGDLLEAVPGPGASGFAALAHAGSAALPPGETRVRVAPFPRLIEPGYAQPVPRGTGFDVVIEPVPPETWVRVTMNGAGAAVAATDVGGGRWEFRPGTLDALGTGGARVLIELETSCGLCPGPPRLAAKWLTHSEVEVPVVLY